MSPNRCSHQGNEPSRLAPGLLKFRIPLKCNENKRFHTQPKEHSLKMSVSRGTRSSCGTGAQQGHAESARWAFRVPASRRSVPAVPQWGEEGLWGLQWRGPQAREGCQGAEPPPLEWDPDVKGRKRRSEKAGVALVSELETGLGTSAGGQWLAGLQSVAVDEFRIWSWLSLVPPQGKDPDPTPYCRPPVCPRKGQGSGWRGCGTWAAELGTGG